MHDWTNPSFHHRCDLCCETFTITKQVWGKLRNENPVPLGPPNLDNSWVNFNKMVSSVHEGLCIVRVCNWWWSWCSNLREVEKKLHTFSMVPNNWWLWLYPEKGLQDHHCFVKGLLLHLSMQNLTRCVDVLHQTLIGGAGVIPSLCRGGHLSVVSSFNRVWKKSR